MEQISMKNTSEEILKKVIVNEQDDYILLNANDSSLVERYMELVKWLEEKQRYYEQQEKKFAEKYKDQKAIEQKENGDVEVNTDMLLDLTRMQCELYKETCSRIDAVFNQEVVKKYFRSCYEITPDFVPDEECIIDLINSLSEVVEKIYKTRMERIKNKYNTNRQGRRAAARGKK